MLSCPHRETQTQGTTKTCGKLKFLSFLFQTAQRVAALYAALRLQKTIVSHLPYSRTFGTAQMVLLTLLTSQQVQKLVGSIKWEWSLLGFLKLASQVWKETVPKQHQMSSQHALIFTWVVWSYFQVAKIKFMPSSFLKFSDAAYGDAYELQRNVDAFYTDIKQSKTVDCSHLHSKQTCQKHLLHGAVRWLNVLKWYLKFHFCIYLVITVAASLKNKTINGAMASKLVKKTIKSSVTQSLSVFIAYYGTYYFGPCFVTKACNKKASQTEYFMHFWSVFIPILLVSSSRLLTKDKNAGLTLFGIHSICQFKMNEMCGVSTLRNEVKADKSEEIKIKKDPVFFQRKEFNHQILSLYIICSLCFAMWLKKSGRKMNVINQLFASLLV